MKRNWNAWLWAGFGTTLVGAFSYISLFIWFPITRDVPWVSYLLFIAAGCLLGIGLQRAFGQPERYRGKASGVILGVLSLAMIGMFCYFTFILSKDMPASTDAPHAGQHAPRFTLPDGAGRAVALDELLKTHKAVLLIFYRGYW